MSGSTGEKGSLTQRRAFQSLPRYRGNAEEFDDWKFRIRRFLEDEKGYKELLTFIEDYVGETIKEVDIDDFELNEDAVTVGTVKVMDHQLYQVLALNCDDKALAMIRNLEEKPYRGLHSWKKLVGEHLGMTGQRKVSWDGSSTPAAAASMLTPSFNWSVGRPC